jgi:tetratricopeptide (TPR) repeat protein
MAKVFLSYDRDDTERARPVALALEKAGHAVWWDLHIRGGEQYTKVIDEALKAADAVVVLWSESSVESAWVRDEAAAGRDSGRLVPASLDDTVPPLGFRQYQTIDLSHWKGRGKPSVLSELLGSIEAVAGIVDEKAAAPTRATSLAPGRFSLPKWAIMAIAAFAVIAVAWLLVNKTRGSHGAYTVAVTASDDAARPLARDLLVKLGRLQTAQSGSLRLSGPEAASTGKTDLIFEVANESGGSQSSASLLLMLGKDRSLLWSKDFEQPSGKMADLKQQLAYTAARVLRCAFEGLEYDGRPLKAQTFKTYLNGCSEIEETAAIDPSAVIPIMRKVIADEPRFTPAWATLVLAQSQITETAYLERSSANEQRNELRKAITDARRVDPNLAEATIAEISLVPAYDFNKNLELADRAEVQSPNNTVVFSARSNLLRRVGRMRESIADAQRAAQLDPLSPLTRNNYISALYYAGKFEAARQELATAEQLWPGTETVLDVKLRYHLRYGDPKEALKIVQAKGLEFSMERFLAARINPSPGNLTTLKEYMDNRLKTGDLAGLSFYTQAAGEFGWESDLYDVLLKWPDPHDLGSVADIFFRPTMKKFRSDPRFMLIAKRSGLLDHWRTNGHWPDFCFEPDLSYDCKKEAAKLGA